jgi:aminoglycoside/choline kinase family phosphotransferase
VPQPPKFCPSALSGYSVGVPTSANVPAGPPADLEALLEICLKERVSRLETLPGGLSPRRFFRVARVSGEPAIVMWLPEDSPERALASRLKRQLPFLEMRTLLEKARVRVPRLFGALPEHGLIVVEDLGETLADRIAREPSAAPALYRRAVEDLAAAQQALAELPDDCIVRTRSFDHGLLTWEVEHFREWGVEALGTALSSAERAAFDSATRFLVDAIVAMPQGFVHRDYQSRNLLALADGGIGWIDFQDALLGPRAYDLVALLRDSYQSFDEDFVSARLAEFSRARGHSVEDAAALRGELDLITVQRKLKDAGRFVFFERSRGDASYLRYFVPTLELVRAALSRLAPRPELAPLSAIVSRQIEIGRSRGMLPA